MFDPTRRNLLKAAALLPLADSALPSLESRHGILLEGVGDTAAGRSVAVDAQGSCHITLPRGSAAWVRLNRSA